MVFDVSDKQGHCSGTCAHTVLAGQQEGAHKTASEYLQSASAKMMLGFLPPSSRVTLFRLLFPAASWISLPTCGGSRGCISSFTCWDLRCRASLNLPISGKLSLINPTAQTTLPVLHTHTHTHGTHARTYTPPLASTETGEQPQLTAEISISGPGGCGEEEGTLCL